MPRRFHISSAVTTYKLLLTFLSIWFYNALCNEFPPNTQWVWALFSFYLAHVPIVLCKRPVVAKFWAGPSGLGNVILDRNIYTLQNFGRHTKVQIHVRTRSNSSVLTLGLQATSVIYCHIASCVHHMAKKQRVRTMLTKVTCVERKIKSSSSSKSWELGCFLVGTLGSDILIY